ncbi:hypothetical protein J7M28_03145 [bacterium]|nr:hypothetical protein [bacterium]
MTRHLRNLGIQFQISLPLDGEGYLGRECPSTDCERYFKIKPGTGLEGENLPVHCPYCGHKGPMDHFHTQSQINYVTSVVERKVQNAVVRDMKDMARDFNRQTRGSLLSLSMDVKSSPVRLHHYAERELETNVECGNCTLQYSVYGVFAFCPDCGQHNSLHILDKNLEVIEKMLVLATSTAEELAGKLIENALEDCVSAFDGFGRELCRVHAQKAADPAKAEKVSFQNLDGAKANVLSTFGIDLSACVTSDEWAAAVRGFQKRHLFAHKMGVVDEEYLAKTGDPNAVVGRKIRVDDSDVRAVLQVIRKVAKHLSENLVEDVA